MLKAKILIPVIALSVAATGATLWSTGVVSAQGNGNGDIMTEKLSSKLGIDQSKVSTAMDQIKDERHAERQAEIKAKLDEAVKAGTITQAQEDAIIARQSQMQQKREQERTENEQWLTDNNLSQDTLRDIGAGMGFGGGKGGMRGSGPNF